MTTIDDSLIRKRAAMTMIRDATPADAEQAAQVMRQSIEELCLSDHRQNDDALRMWLENKTPEQFCSWLTSPGQCFLVAEIDGTICAVGGATQSGEIILNYVAPSARFQGISKMMLGALERYLRDQGLDRALLTSTETAHRFYRSLGYGDTGAPELWGQLPGYPMAKDLA